MEDYRSIDSILSGVCNLDFGGNKKPLNMNTMFWLLKSLPVITTKGVEDLYGCCKQHATKLATALRVASNAFTATYGKYEVPKWREELTT
ncbi:MAG: hypothetical protein PGN26_11475 [Xylophilus ampelinus]